MRVQEPCYANRNYIHIHTQKYVYVYVRGYDSKPMILRVHFLNKMSSLQKDFSATGLPLKSSGGSFQIGMTFAHSAE